MPPSWTFIVSTRNNHKAREIEAILGSNHQLLTLADFPGSPKILEDGDTFEINARKKALGLAEWLDQTTSSRTRLISPNPVYVLADDSGLEVDFLGGAPGVRSARFAATEDSNTENCTDDQNNRKLLKLLDGVPEIQRGARFRCVIALTPLLIIERAPSAAGISADTIFFTGSCPGRILTAPRGVNGFGYDPLFVPGGYEQTFAELGDAAKNGLSHRARALAKLSDWITTRF